MVKQQATLRHLANTCDKAKTIKLVDIIDNTCSLIRYEVNFDSVYLIEKTETEGITQRRQPSLARSGADAEQRSANIMPAASFDKRKVV